MSLRINNITSFKGYNNNIMAYAENFPESSIAVMNIELNDDGKYKDLTKFHEVKKSFALMEKPTVFSNIYDDVVSLTLSANEFDNSLNIMLDDIYLPTANVLRQMEIQKPKEFVALDAAAIKAYTFISSLMKRIMNDSDVQSATSDSLVHQVEKYLNVLSEFTDNAYARFMLINKAARGKVPPQSIAASINDVIKFRMERYFGIKNLH